MYIDLKKYCFAAAALMLTCTALAQTGYNIIRWGGTLTTNPATFSAGSKEGVTDGAYGDNNRMTITGVAAADRWVKFSAAAPIVLSSYSLSTYSTYRPTGWTLSGSNDGNTWTDLDAQTGQTFTSYVARNFVPANNVTAYSYYRITFTAVASTTYLSVCELELFTTSSFPPAPVLSGTSLSGTEASFSWNYRLKATDSFQVERSLNGTDFTRVTATAGTVNSLLDQTLTPSTLFHYRVRGKLSYGYSDWSNVFQLTTNDFQGQSADITDDGGKLYASADNNGGAGAAEGSSKLIDNSIATKWLVFPAQASGNLSAVYKPVNSYIVTSYTITTANDAPNRDPKSWAFYGSNDSTNWIKLDTQVNQLGFAERFIPVTYVVSNPGTVPYTFYRILFTANNGATDVRYQVAEWQILGISATAPYIPQQLTISAKTTSSLSLSWTQNTAQPVSKYRLQRSEDGFTYTTIKDLPGDVLAYTDAGLKDSAQYWYRIQALGTNPGAVSGWSIPVSGTTNFQAGLPLGPGDLKASFVKDTLVGIQWTDRSYNETGFKVQRSVDNVEFTDIKTLDANSVSFNDSLVWSAYTYYYRVYAVNAQGNSVYSNTITVTTTGFNQPPRFTAPVINRTVCSNTAGYTFTIPGITPGTSNERTQKLSVISVTVDSTHFFSNLSFVPDITDGVATIKVKGAGTAAFGDTVAISVLVRDNGGIVNVGNDSARITFKVIFVPLQVTITSDRDITGVPRYVTVHLTAVTNYPSTTTSYAWDDAPGILGSRNLIQLRVKPTAQSTYSVHATSTAGCQASAQVTLVPDADYKIGTVITPNGDGRNDKWVIWNIGSDPNNSVKVFDRSGRQVYSMKNYSNDWDGRYNGKTLPEGAYYYIVDFGDGKPVTGMLNIVY